MKVKKIPLRKCLGCQEQFDKRDLLRVVKNKEGEISLDMTGKQNGRGAYICKKKSCLEAAIKNHGLERSLKTSIDSEVIDKLIEQIGDANV